MLTREEQIINLYRKQILIFESIVKKRDLTDEENEQFEKAKLEVKEYDKKHSRKKIVYDAPTLKCEYMDILKLDKEEQGKVWLDLFKRDYEDEVSLIQLGSMLESDKTLPMFDSSGIHLNSTLVSDLIKFMNEKKLYTIESTVYEDLICVKQKIANKETLKPTEKVYEMLLEEYDTCKDVDKISITCVVAAQNYMAKELLEKYRAGDFNSGLLYFKNRIILGIRLTNGKIASGERALISKLLK